MTSKVVLFLAAVTNLFLAGCSSFYSSSVLGHESLIVPTPFRSPEAVTSEFSLVAKATPAVSLFTNDSTRALQVGLSLQHSFRLSEFARVATGMTASGYFSQTSIFLSRIGTTSQVEHAAFGYGYVGNGKFGLVFDSGESSSEFGFSGSYNREFGEYLSLRSSLSTLTNEKTDSVFDTKRVDLSPRGSSLEIFPYFQSQWNHRKDEQVSITYGLGASLPNWPESNHYLLVNRIAVAYRLRNLWWAGSLENLHLLNAGIGFTVGTVLN